MNQQYGNLSKVLEEVDQLHATTTQSIDNAEQLLNGSHSELNDLTSQVGFIAGETDTYYQVNKYCTQVQT